MNQLANNPNRFYSKQFEINSFEIKRFVSVEFYVVFVRSLKNKINLREWIIVKTFPDLFDIFVWNKDGIVE